VCVECVWCVCAVYTLHDETVSCDSCVSIRLNNDTSLLLLFLCHLLIITFISQNNIVRVCACVRACVCIINYYNKVKADLFIGFDIK